MGVLCCITRYKFYDEEEIESSPLSLNLNIYLLLEFSLSFVYDNFFRLV